MSDGLAVWLQAMFHSGAVASYIITRVPENKLATGWIGQSVLQKGFTGKLEDKKNQENLVIPLDRFVRLTQERNEDTKSIFGLCLVGVRGLTKSRFTAVISQDCESKSESSIAVAVSSERFMLHDMVSQLIQLTLSKQEKREFIEPNLDYIEQLKSDTSDELVTQLISIRLPSSFDKMIETIQSTIKGGTNSKRIVVHYGKISDISPLVILFSKWLVGLNLFQKIKDSVATIMFMTSSGIQLCLWDTPQKIATFSLVNSQDIRQAFEKYVLPLWFASDDLTTSDSKSPTVIVSGEKDHRHTISIPRPIKDMQSNESIQQLKERIDLLEAQLSQIERISSRDTPIDDKSREIVQSRLTDIIDRLESLASKLDLLEKRIGKVTK